MKSDITTQDEFITTLVDVLERRTGLTDVTVTSADLGLADRGADSISVFGIPDGNESWDGIGNYAREESYTVEMGCLVIRPGADEDAIRAARDRAYELFHEVADAVRTNPTLGTRAYVSQMTTANLIQGWSDLGRWCELHWSIRAQGRLEITS